MTAKVPADDTQGGMRYRPTDENFQRDLYSVYDWMRREHPLHHDAERDVWAVSRFADVEAVLLDWENFSSRTPSVPEPAGHLAVQDPPRHTQLRRLISRVFTPRQLAHLGTVAGEISDQLGAEAARARNFDLVSGFAEQLPGRVFAHMMGIPDAKVGEFQRLLSDYVDAIAAAGPGQRPDDRAQQQVHQAISELVAERRARPREDLLTQLVEAEIDGERLTDAEVLGFCFNLILAANETTANLLANGVATLYQHPDQLARLQERPELLPATIDEVLRYESPVQSLHRTVVRDVEVAGGRLPEGAHLMVLYGSANRDPEVFPNADMFDIERASQPHLAFGRGIHFCLGSNLARMEAREGFRTLLGLMEHYRPADEPVAWKRSPWQRSLHHLNLEKM